MAYKTMLKRINDRNLLLETGAITEAEYAAWKEIELNKLDVFMSCNRLTASQYEELVGLFK